MKHFTAVLVVLVVGMVAVTAVPARAFTGASAMMARHLLDVVTGAITQPTVVEGTTWFKVQKAQRISEMGQEGFDAWIQHIHNILENSQFPNNDEWLAGFPIRRAYVVAIIVKLCDVDDKQFGGCWPTMSQTRQRLWENDIYGQYKIACLMARDYAMQSSEIARVDSELVEINRRLANLEEDVKFLMGRCVLIDVDIIDGHLWKKFAIGRQEWWVDAGQKMMNGKDGKDGVGIKGIELVDCETARFILTDGSHYDIKLPRGLQGPMGPAGPAGACGTNGTNGVSPYQLMLKVVNVTSTQKQIITQTGEVDNTANTGNNSPVAQSGSVANAGAQAMTGPVTVVGGDVQVMQIQWSADGGTTWIPLCDLHNGVPGPPGPPGTPGVAGAPGAPAPAQDPIYVAPVANAPSAPAAINGKQEEHVAVDSDMEQTSTQTSKIVPRARTGNYSPVAQGSGTGAADSKAAVGPVTATGGHAQVINTLNIGIPPAITAMLGPPGTGGLHSDGFTSTTSSQLGGGQWSSWSAFIPGNGQCVPFGSAPGVGPARDVAPGPAR